MPIVSLLLAFFCGYVLSLLCFLGRTTSLRRRTVLLVVTASLTFAAPLGIPAAFPVLRCLVATTFVFFVMKSWEVYLHPKKYVHLSLGRYARFLMNHCLTIPGDTDHFGNGLPLWNRVRHFAVRTLYICLATAALYGVFRHDWSRHSFWSEHFVKSAAAFIWIDCAFPWYGAWWRLAGVRTVMFNDHSWLASTPAEFWRRYHRPAHEWLYQDIFRPLRRLRPPVAVLMLTFLVSGLMHEYIVAVSLGHATGHMLLFFILHGLASSLTWRLSLSGTGKCCGLVVTYAFLLASSIYFFVPVNEGIAFYTNEIPSWVWPR